MPSQRYFQTGMRGWSDIHSTNAFIHNLICRSHASLGLVKVACCYMEAARCKLLSGRTAGAIYLNGLELVLHCPRRVFLGCLVLAFKFLYDRSYNNRAWATIVDLSARDIGRCERAVGEILEWRLWVGKAIT